ncbi:synaptophysin-like protein 2 isoform X2 [Carcharodon carcharias]|uniref:synaptophysin-like protein 2 isoform X2 n=1 Tax=Carcharodon carcharias TaxID=13397 RepID=UPI001B7E746C|nr:synaptophysin-like protein 2 isoform X2 [Carcharodon carcharias]
MEAVAPVKKFPAFKLDINPLKEPLGFIKVLQWVFAIFAFATCGGYTGTSMASVKCLHGKKDLISINFSYPFRLNQISYRALTCKNDTVYETLDLIGDFSSSAEFFVAIGVFTFLYCTAALVLYLGYQSLYQQNKYLPIADFVVTALFAFLWLVSSSAWAQGLTDVKSNTRPPALIRSISACYQKTVVCTPGALPPMGRLNASVIFGFMNFILWSGNSWFVLKETSWHKPAIPQDVAEQGTNVKH